MKQDVTCPCGKARGEAYWREVHAGQSDARIAAERQRLAELCPTCREAAKVERPKARTAAPAA